MKRLAIGILNQNRYELFEKTVNSLIKSIGEYRFEFDLYLWDNGSDEQVRHRINRDYGHMFNTISWQKENMGIGAGLKGLHHLSEDHEFYLHLENDWECTAGSSSHWYKACFEAMDTFKDLGIIKLRAKGDGQYEMQGDNLYRCAASYSPWWVPGMDDMYESNILEGGLELHHAKIRKGYTNNPAFIRKEMVKDWQWDDSVKGYGMEEENTEVLPAKQGWETGQLDAGFFRHIG